MNKDQALAWATAKHIARLRYNINVLAGADPDIAADLALTQAKEFLNDAQESESDFEAELNQFKADVLAKY